MKIDHTSIKGTTGPAGTGAVRPYGQAGAAASARPAGAGDQVDLSARSRQVASLQAKLQSLPDLRGDVLREVKGRLEGGAYSVNVDALAERLLNARVVDV